MKRREEGTEGQRAPGEKKGVKSQRRCRLGKWSEREKRECYMERTPAGTGTEMSGRDTALGKREESKGEGAGKRPLLGSEQRQHRGMKNELKTKEVSRGE